MKTPATGRRGGARPRVLVACASFKGTLTSLQAGRALGRGLARAGFRADVLALADGGEGLVEALARAVPRARRVTVRCRGPRGEKRRACFVLLPPGPGRPVHTAVLEMAASSGLLLMPPRRRNPAVTTTLGVGDQIRAALARGARAIILGIGGSATNDGGAGMAQALGARLLDAAGRDLPPGGAALARLARVDISALDPRVGVGSGRRSSVRLEKSWNQLDGRTGILACPGRQECLPNRLAPQLPQQDTRPVAVAVLCDVNNPLCGRRGASAVFGPQKGARPGQVKRLDRALARFARIVERDLGVAVRDLPGAGAAGGLGAGCVAFLGARLTPGIHQVLDLIGFGERLRGVAFVVTGEGRLDRTSLMGKAPAGVAARARAAGVPCVAIGGTVDPRVRGALRRRFLFTESLAEFAGARRAALARPGYWLERLAFERGREWRAGAGCRKAGRSTS